jgi:hypothetical protein
MTENKTLEKSIAKRLKEAETTSSSVFDPCSIRGKISASSVVNKVGALQMQLRRAKFFFPL